jgi:hypothetical protein
MEANPKLKIIKNKNKKRRSRSLKTQKMKYKMTHGAPILCTDSKDLE